MKKLRLVLFDLDMEYIELFANYIRTSEYATRFDVKLFSRYESLQEYLKSGERTDILLLSSEGMQVEPEIENIGTLLYLVNDMEQEPGKDELFKYQPLSQVMSRVLSSHYEQGDKKTKIKKPQNANTSVISVFSASGGAGKTTTAFHLANQMKENGLNVFYLNLELINTSPLLFDVENLSSSSPLLYYLKTNADQLQSKMKELVAVDQDTAIPFFYFMPSAEEVLDLSEKEIELLMDNLIKMEEYDYIIVDLESTINPTVLTALKKSDHVLWLLANDMYSFHKTGYLLEELHGFVNDGSFSNRVQLILNKYTGSMDPALSETGIEIDHYLPYVPEWKQLVDKEQLNNHVFEEYIQKLISSFSRATSGVGG
ncbi:AAA domain-containing protein [Gracilibacillus orientalis]|uniref:AAA domain-containing protein n=1 Tax=Gracilibacillus orientalis TaxID=334253 RepID=A0A1I4P5R9_9BACI|nr:AAA family ATPase [Gracilibacillus orientalis]SFM23122.1 AAA domain-containing protein [Gracilibacillus orientalis]